MEGLITIWQDKAIVPEKEWEEKQSLSELKRAGSRVMLMSAAFCASRYCY